MPPKQAQEFLFQRIKEILPPSASLTDVVSEILNVSTDSAYRRIRNETPLVLEEAKLLCDRFELSLDQVLHIKTNSVVFENVRINNREYSYEQYLSDLTRLIEHISSFQQKEIIYLTKDMPIFHNFYFKPLVAFRYFFWMKTILQHPDYVSRTINLDSVPANIDSMSANLVRCYTLVPSTEILNTESVNSVISQIEFFRETGVFSSAADIRAVYDAVYQTILHLKAQVELGCKFLPGENPQTKKNNFNFFYNRVSLGETTVLVKTDNAKTVYLNYDVLNYMVTRDENFCNQCDNDLQNLIRRATVISQTSERQRNIFFGILLAKIEDRQRKL